MLEILMIYHFGKKVGETASEKGYPGALFTVLFVVLWFFGEAVVVIPGAAMAEARGGMLCGVYILALMAAAVASFSVYLLVLLLPDAQGSRRLTALDYDHAGNPVRRRKRRGGRPKFDDDEEEPRPRRRREAEFDDADDESISPRKRPGRRPRPKFDDDE
jgi:hypothetical protein